LSCVSRIASSMYFAIKLTSANISFKQVGGEMSTTVILKHMNHKGRICACGAISQYNDIDLSVGKICACGAISQYNDIDLSVGKIFACGAISQYNDIDLSVGKICACVQHQNTMIRYASRRFQIYFLIVISCA